MVMLIGTHLTLLSQRRPSPSAPETPFRHSL